MSIFPTRILLATDGSQNVAHATEVTVQLSKETGSKLHLVYVGEDAYSATLVYPEATDPGGVEREDPVLIEQLLRQFEQMSRRVLETEVEKVREAGGTVVQAHLRMGEAAAEIVDLAEELGAGLVVVGSRGLGGIRRALMGSVSDSVVRHAHCPVLVVRDEPLAIPTRILLATDGSKDALLAADAALELAAEPDSELHVTYVEPMPEKHVR